jgi:hypothetical protein
VSARALLRIRFREARRDRLILIHSLSVRLPAERGQPLRRHPESRRHRCARVSTDDMPGRTETQTPPVLLDPLLSCVIIDMCHPILCCSTPHIPTHTHTHTAHVLALGLGTGPRRPCRRRRRRPCRQRRTRQLCAVLGRIGPQRDRPSPARERARMLTSSTRSRPARSMPSRTPRSSAT